MLLSVVYKHGTYWMFHAKSLYNDKGQVDKDYSHTEQAWQVVRL